MEAAAGDVCTQHPWARLRVCVHNSPSGNFTAPRRESGRVIPVHVWPRAIASCRFDSFYWRRPRTRRGSQNACVNIRVSMRSEYSTDLRRCAKAGVDSLIRPEATTHELTECLQRAVLGEFVCPRTCQPLCFGTWPAGEVETVGILPIPRVPGAALHTRFRIRQPPARVCALDTTWKHELWPVRESAVRSLLRRAFEN